MLVIWRSHLDDSVSEWRFGMKCAEWPYSISIMTLYSEIVYETVGREASEYWRSCTSFWDHCISIHRVCQHAEINSAYRKESYRVWVYPISIIFFCNLSLADMLQQVYKIVSIIHHIAITNCPFRFAFSHLPKCGQLLRQKGRKNFTWNLCARFS